MLGSDYKVMILLRHCNEISKEFFEEYMKQAYLPVFGVRMPNVSRKIKLLFWWFHKAPQIFHLVAQELYKNSKT